MAKGIRKPCKQCGADHHGFGEYPNALDGIPPGLIEHLDAAA